MGITYNNKKDKSKMKHYWINRILWVGFLGLPFALLGDSLLVLSLGFPFLCICAFFGTFLFLESNSLDRTALLLGLFFGISPLIMSAFSPDIGASFIRAASGFVGFLIFAYSVSIAKFKANLVQEYAYIITVSGVILSLYYIINFFIKTLQNDFSKVISDRIVGGLASLPWGASNSISAVIFFSLITSLYLISNSKKRMWLYISTFVLVSGIALTLSRTGILIALCVVVFYVFQKNFLSKLPILIVATLIVVSSLIAWSVNDSISFQNVFSDRLDISDGNGRTDSWVQKLNYLSSNLTSPIGYYGSNYVFEGFTAHNFFITTLVEQSVIGLFALSFVFYPFFRFKLFSGQNKIFIVGLFLILCNLFVEDANFTQQYIFISWLYFTMIYVFMIQNSRIRISNISLFKGST
jgi:hypothetical protein